MAGITVAQLGARMHYAVPNLLHQSGALERLFTDACATSGMPRYMAALPEALRPSFIKRLLGRRPEVPRERITAFTTFGLEYAWRRSRARTQTELTRTHLWAGTLFCERILAHGLPPTTRAVYGFNSASLELFEAIRTQGIVKVLEQTIAPYEIEREILTGERATHADLARPDSDDALAAEFSARERREWELADVIVCGSEFVREGIGRAAGPRERCVVIPYGVALEDRAPRQTRVRGPLRVLTVGAVGLRKGSHYVFEAARQLSNVAQFRMVGSVGIAPEKLAAMRGEVEVAGPVPRSEIRNEFAWADVFLLPSLCEGSATVTYEALAAGLPVICTPNTGSVVRDGMDGFIVPVGDVEAIVRGVRALAGDRALLARMSASATQRASDFDLLSYQRRLRSCLDEALRK